MHWYFPLTRDQENVATQIQPYVDRSETILVHAVCGAGKTEIVLLAIQKALNQGQRVGFIIPRKEVVIELKKRLHTYFPSIPITAVYGSHTQTLSGDIIVCTAHQAYRYPRAFGLVIVDEIDAFPYKDNRTLQGIVEHTGVAGRIYLSATPSIKDQTQYPVIRLYSRPHQHPLPVPSMRKGNWLIRFFVLFRFLLRMQRKQLPSLVYVPTIHQVFQVSKNLRYFFPNVYGIHSQSPQKEMILSQFFQHPDSILVTTTLMERGITIPRVQVVVWNAHHLVFSTDTLIQIAGRVGRKAPDFKGEVLWIAPKISIPMKESIQTIQKQNSLGVHCAGSLSKK